MSHTDEYIQSIYDLLVSGEKQNKRSIDKIASQYGITDPTQIKELTELAIVLRAREIAQSKQTVSERYEQICELYANQVNLSHRTSQSIMLQQYSTPAPIAFLASMYVLQNEIGMGSVKRGGRFTKNHFNPTAQRSQKPTLHDKISEIVERKTGLPLSFEPSAGNGLLTIALPA